MIDTKSDPGAWADHIASTGKFRALPNAAVMTCDRCDMDFVFASHHQSEIAALREALVWYRGQAKLVSQHQKGTIAHTGGLQALAQDAGQRADEALRGGER